MILVIGSGVAGLTAARAAHAAGAEVILVTAGSLASGDTCSTALAQGGIAAAIGPGDTASAHLADTIAAGAGLVDAQAARVLVTDGAADVRRLIAEGFAPDRGPAGELALGLEGAHGAHRIVHAGGDRTGAAMHAHLVERLPAGVRVVEHATLERLLLEPHAIGQLAGGQQTIAGAELRGADGAVEIIHAAAVVLATGGYSALFDRTSNHAGARGEGIAVAAEAGAAVADLEFVQFHPTVLAGTGALISEAVRGAGARLLDGAGSPFMQGRHPAAELAPRDIVSREIHRMMRDSGTECVWLDARPVEVNHGRGSLARLFPGIDAVLRGRGFDWASEPVPVAPAAHYTMGGVASDLDGRASLPGLFVAGEAAATGVHGANRLASNSLLEGLVFGRRAGAAAARYATDRSRRSWEFSGDALPQLLARAKTVTIGAVGAGSERPDRTDRLGATPPQLGRLLSREFGIEREAAGIAAALGVIAELPGREARLAELIAHAALARIESRGAHQRADYPQPDPAQVCRRAWELAGAPAAARDLTPTPLTTPARRSLAPC